VRRLLVGRVTDLNLTVVSKPPAGKPGLLKVAWTPPVGAAGYRFLRDGKGVAVSWDAKLAQATFSVPDGDGHEFVVEAVQTLAQGSVTVDGGAPIAAYTSYLYGQNTDTGSDKHSDSWVNTDSPTSEHSGTGSSEYWREIIWDPGHHYANHQTTVLWSVWPGSGEVGRLLNFHNDPQLRGGWYWGGDVSPLALHYTGSSQIDNKGGQPYEGLYCVAQPTGDSPEKLQRQYHWTLIPIADWQVAAAAGSRFDIVMQIRWGNVNDPGWPLGALKVWVTRGNEDPSNVPVLDVSGINTYWFLEYNEGAGFVKPPADGQAGVTLWVGAYNSDSSGTPNAAPAAYVTSTVPRIGVDLAEALADGVDWPITTVSYTAQHSHAYTGGNNSYSAPAPPLDSSLFQVPSIVS
jgi:hypothetical protein